MLRVDRTDPSKNAVRGFAAFGRLLELEPELEGRIQLLALLDPSRQEIPEYVDYRDATEAAAAVVNARFGRPGWEPVRLDVRDDFPASVAAFLEYDVLLVNPVKDGLNLVAKEAPLVNERDGAVVLSREAGAYEELHAWVRRGRPARRRRAGRGPSRRDPASARGASGPAGRDPRPRPDARPGRLGREGARGARPARAPDRVSRRATMAVVQRHNDVHASGRTLVVQLDDNEARA